LKNKINSKYRSLRKREEIEIGRRKERGVIVVVTVVTEEIGTTEIDKEIETIETIEIIEIIEIDKEIEMIEVINQKKMIDKKQTDKRKRKNKEKNKEKDKDKDKKLRKKRERNKKISRSLKNKNQKKSTIKMNNQAVLMIPNLLPVTQTPRQKKERDKKVNLPRVMIRTGKNQRKKIEITIVRRKTTRTRTRIKKTSTKQRK
jgi:hypothetical protein